ncbi:RagB/SusD family nutrient uptake outer membrane protein [Dyadobacter psychrotolerans]|uniref:RagB/SusD family nutrient uptake outer membrane protein n=1 Tax=Dyadobacter psychrotolerans TaxID=2541721 RepID=A0A4V2Z4Y2_9BACT|nr:RagB/SusD family nutrient uptake outer membrane protein [Dyadobacter psychrotolerans]TDE17228.1 RagB/SusD family nutrient uptake outer membrane protein [Dyadobacter psychrotolerans]
MKFTFSILFACILLVSCSKDFLDRQPEDTLSPGSFYRNPAEIKSGLVGCYKVLQSIYNQTDMPLIIELMSDDGKDRFRTGSWQTFKKTNADSQSGIWTNNFKMVANCNTIIGIIDTYTAKNAEEEKTVKAYRAEASFLRALAYFNLVRIYGAVPLVPETFTNLSSAFGIGRAPVNEVYAKLIIPDLEYAAANCFKKADLKGEEARASKGAALTMLGKVYLTLNNPTKAAETLKKLIVDNEAGAYSLLPNYKDVFASNSKFHAESVFEVNFNIAAGQPSYWFRWVNNDVGLIWGVAGASNLLVEHNLMREFVSTGETVRYKTAIDSGYIASSTIPIQAWVIKHSPAPAQLKPFNNTGTDNNYIITRYADALLMYAEALMVLGKKDEALVYVNQVRTRAKVPAITAAQLNIDAILHERRMELAYEGHRYFDLVRTGKAIDVLTKVLLTKVDYDTNIAISAPIPEEQLILPIPVGEIEKDQTLPQNPGY